MVGIADTRKNMTIGIVLLKMAECYEKAAKHAANFSEKEVELLVNLVKKTSCNHVDCTLYEYNLRDNIV